MYHVVLVTVLTGGLTAQGPDGSSDGVRRSVEDLKQAVEQLRKEQREHRIEGLKQAVDELRSEKTDQKIEDLRSAVEDLRRRYHGPRALWYPGPGARAEVAPPNRARVILSLPAGATCWANDREVAVAAPSTSLLTPELEPGKDYYYDFRVKATRGGKDVTRVKRLPVRAGAVARLAFEDMTPAEREKE